MGNKVLRVVKRYTMPLPTGGLSVKELIELRDRVSTGNTSSHFVLLSYIPKTPERRCPETMAFIANKFGYVLDWSELCVSRARHEDRGFDECIEILEGGE